MVKLNIKRQSGQITMSTDDFEHLLNCWANQRFVHEAPTCGDAMELKLNNPKEYEATQQGIQECIDDAYRQCRDALHGEPISA